MAKKRKSLKFALWLSILLLGVAAYDYGHFYYQKPHQISRIAAKLQQPKADLAPDVVAADPDMKVTTSSLKPLQHYFQHDRPAAKRLSRNLQQGKGQQIKIVEAGHYFLLFPRYKLRLPVYRPQVETNHPNSYLAVDGNSRGQMAGGGQNYYQDLGMVFPGRYHLAVRTKVSGRRLKADAVENIWSSKTINMILRTATFQIRSVPGGTVYLNDRPVKKLDREGQAIFKNYPLTKHMELYVKTSYHGRSLRSYTVKDLASRIDPEFSASDDNTGDYSGANNYNGNQSNDVYQDIEGDYIVNPLWSGLIAQKQAGQILAANFTKAQANAFEKGKENSDYQTLKKQNRVWRKGKKNVRIKVQVKTILPADKNYSLLSYQVMMTYRQRGKRGRKIFNYQNGLFHLVKGRQLIKKIGTEVIR